MEEVTGRPTLDAALAAYPRISRLRLELRRNAERRRDLLVELRTLAEWAAQRGQRVQASVANAVLSEAQTS